MASDQLAHKQDGLQKHPGGQIPVNKISPVDTSERLKATYLHPFLTKLVPCWFSACTASEVVRHSLHLSRLNILHHSGTTMATTPTTYKCRSWLCPHRHPNTTGPTPTHWECYGQQVSLSHGSSVDESSDTLHKLWLF